MLASRSSFQFGACIAMNSLTRNVGYALLGLVVLGAAGCQESNESIAEQQAKKTAGAQVNAPPPPKSQAEFGQRSQANNPFAKGSGTGYPGTGGAAKK